MLAQRRLHLLLHVQQPKHLRSTPSRLSLWACMPASIMHTPPKPEHPSEDLLSLTRTCPRGSYTGHGTQRCSKVSSSR